MPDQLATSDQFQQILAAQLVNARVERDEYRERMNDLVDERDGLDFELRQTREQRDAAQRLHGMWKKTAEDRLGDLTKAGGEIQRQDALLIQQRDHLAAERDQARKQLDTMRGIARGNRRHVATLTGILDTIEQLAKRWTDRPGTPQHDCAIDILKAINSGGTAPVPGSSPRAPEPVAANGCDDCSVEPGETHRYASCPGALRALARAGWDPSSPQWAVIRAAIAWRNTVAASALDDTDALIEAIDALPAGESQASEPAPAANDPVLAEIAAERSRQDARWGVQNHPDGTGDGGDLDRERADYARRRCQLRAAEGVLRWRDVIEEEIAEAFAETDPQALRGELVQVAAVAVAWVEAIDRRNAAESQPSGRDIIADGMKKASDQLRMVGEQADGTGRG